MALAALHATALHRLGARHVLGHRRGRRGGPRGTARREGGNARVEGEVRTRRAEAGGNIRGLKETWD